MRLADDWPVASTTPRSGLVPGALLLDRYRLRSFLGRGGAAEVFLADDERDGGQVVVKVPVDECLRRASERERFRREIAFLARLVHRNVVRVLEAGEERGVAFAVLAYLSGGSLRDRLIARRARAAPAPSPDELASWLPGIASALDFIHASGVLHRDLTPANVLFDAAGVASLTDFGLAKAVHGEASLTPLGFAVGTPAYLAPEQIRDRPLTGRCDQYALATVVYEFVAGRTPFPTDSLGRLLLLKSREDAPSLAIVAPDAPGPVAVAVDRGLRRDPLERFATCEEFAKAVLAGR